jgi:GTP cyclohydrolase IA
MTDRLAPSLRQTVSMRPAKKVSPRVILQRTRPSRGSGVLVTPRDEDSDRWIGILIHRTHNGKETDRMESWRVNGSPDDLTSLVADKVIERKQTRLVQGDGLDGERAAQEAVASLLQWMGQDPNRDGLRDTPRRVATALREMTSGYHLEPARILSTTFPVDYREIVVLRRLHFTSLCEHHLMPFSGTCSLGYLPDGQVAGLSKLARLVSCFAHRLQIQERMTTEIAKALWEHLRPRGVGVVIAARHCCMGCRGVRKPIAQMVTRVLLGELRDDRQIRAEFLRLCERGGRRRRVHSREEHDGNGLHQ